MSFYFEALWYTSNCTKKYQVKSHVLLTHLLSFGCTDDVSYPRNDFPKTIPSVPEDLHFIITPRLYFKEIPSLSQRCLLTY